MHGRPRKPAKAEDLVASAAKAEKLRQLQTQILHNHKHRIYNKEALEICSKLLEVNPEVYTAWNYRKLAVQSNIESCGDQEVIQSILNQELKIAEIALRRNPKCYGAWHHRKWILKLESKAANFDQEFGLLDMSLKADSRNFHGWNHRRFVAALSNVQEEEELSYTKEKINSNFSNYSAWHNRSAILSNLMARNVPGFVPKERVLTEELEFIHNALFTDPDDQSGWFYHLWLLDQIAARDPPSLISTWPAQGSELILSTDDARDIRALPVILYFNTAVKGVSSSTVAIESVLTENDCLIWKPLSTSNNGEASCWVTCINYHERDYHSLEPYSVKVILCPSQDLVSSDGLPLSNASSYEFSLKISHHSPGNSCKESCINMFCWDDEKFSRLDFLQTIPLTVSEVQIPKWSYETLSNEIMLFQELNSEMNCKIAKLVLARLLVARSIPPVSSIKMSKDRTHFEEALCLYNDLLSLDQSHIGYYKDQRSLLLMEQMTSDAESLRNHCWVPKESSLTSDESNVCLRLNHLSLTRIGSVKRLLWVNRLDLSHNELQSIAGLEALQLVSHLNLSHNKLTSITALEPLRLMMSLRVLNISCNEIGAHAIDTKRYLSGLLPMSQELNDYDDEDVKLHWDAILLFKNMHLRQLDVVGNQILTDSFRSLMIKLMPSLRWLDGQLVQHP